MTAYLLAQVDVAIVQQATELRERMLKTAEYNLEHKETVARELADIRTGTGYLDLANDCSRLAATPKHRDRDCERTQQRASRLG